MVPPSTGSVIIFQMVTSVKQVYIPNRKTWRRWLAENHDKEKSIWLVHDKVSNGGKLTYDGIVEEALCFGWIDSTVKKRDDGRSMIYLSVRKPKSIWAKSNKIRVEKLVRNNLMTPAGLQSIQIAKENGSWSSMDAVEDLILPKELKSALSKNETAAKFFETRSPSLKKQVLYYIYSAKQPETREKRVEKIITSLEANKNPFI